MPEANGLLREAGGRCLEIGGKAKRDGVTQSIGQSYRAPPRGNNAMLE